MEVEKKYYKLKLCNFYEKYGKCNYGKNCNYAHGKNELRDFKKYCVNGLNCFKKDCLFAHPECWNYKKNVKICEYFINGFCKHGDNCEFRHKEDNNIEINKDDNNKDFLLLEKDIDSNIIEESINKNNNQENNIKLKEIDEIDVNEIPYLNENTRNIKKDCEIEKSNNYEIKNKNVEKDIIFEIFVDGVKYNNIDDKLNINEDTKVRNNDETQNLIIKLQESFGQYTKEIKKNIDEIFIEDNYIYGINMKLELNKIISEINLFKNNYQDIINNNR
jgi:hypothetical protein